MKFSITLDGDDAEDMAILSKLGFNIQIPAIYANTPPPAGQPAQAFQPPPPNQQPGQQPPPAGAPPATPQPAQQPPPTPQPGGVTQAQLADACQQYAQKYGPKQVKARFAQLSTQLGVNWDKIASIPVERYGEVLPWFQG